MDSTSLRPDKHHPPADTSKPAIAKLIASMRDDQLTFLRTGSEQSTQPGFHSTHLQGVRELLGLLRRLIFPGFFDVQPVGVQDLPKRIEALTSEIDERLATQIRAVLRYGRRPGQHGAESRIPSGISDEQFVALAVQAFIEELPEVRRKLALDVQAAYDGDPAAEHTDEVILCYPGLEAVFVHRVAHELYRLGVPVLPRVMSEQAHSATGIDIHAGARIGESFFVDHGSATVIGETSIIGRGVKIYQGVTLGARSFPKDERGRAIRGIKRHPSIGDRVAIYAGAVILGGDTHIGDDCVIAGGVFVTSSVPAGHVVQQTRPDLILKPTPAGNALKSSAKTASVQPKPLASLQTPDVGWLNDGAGI